MKCPKCGESNNEKAKYCSKCGASIQENKVSIKDVFLEYLFITFNTILKPATTLKDKISKFATFKCSFIFASFVSLIATLINLITAMFTSIVVKSYNWNLNDYETTWVWSNLKNVQYLEIILKSFLIYLGVIFVITVIYYLASLIKKKEVSFPKLLGISTLSLIPLLICSLVISPLIALVWEELGVLIVLAGFICTLVLLYENMNNEIALKGNIKYYFNFACLFILLIIIYFVFNKIFVQNGIEEILDIFN